MRTTFTIELKIDLDPSDDERKGIVKDAVVEAAQSVYTAAALVAKRKPMIAITSDTVTDGTEHIRLFEDDL